MTSRNGVSRSLGRSRYFDGFVFIGEGVVGGSAEGAGVMFLDGVMGTLDHFLIHLMQNWWVHPLRED